MSTTSNTLPPIGATINKGGDPVSLGIPSDDWAASTQQAILGKTQGEPQSQSLAAANSTSSTSEQPQMNRGASTYSVASTAGPDMPGSWGKDSPDSPFKKAGADGPAVVSNDVREALSAASEKAQKWLPNKSSSNDSTIPPGVNAPDSGIAATGPPGHPGNPTGVVDQVRGTLGSLVQGATNALYGTADQSKAGLSNSGVGDLPGSKDETGVARLPEERVNPDPTLNDQPINTAPTGPGYVQQVKDTLGGLYTGATGSAVGGKTVSGGGIGDLPGSKGETDIARLPEERIHPDPTLTDTTLKEPAPSDNSNKQLTSSDAGYLQQARDTLGNLYANATGAVIEGPGPVKLSQESGKPLQAREVTGGGVGDLPGDNSEVSVAKLPEERAHPDPYSETSGSHKSSLAPTSRNPVYPIADNNARTGGAYLVAQPPVGNHPAADDERQARLGGILTAALNSDNTNKTDATVDENVQGRRPVTPPINLEDISKSTPVAPSAPNDPAFDGATTQTAASPRHVHHQPSGDGKGVDKNMGNRGTVGEKDGDSHFPTGRLGADRVGQEPSTSGNNNANTSPKVGMSPLTKTISGPSSPTKISDGSNFKGGHGRSGSTSSAGGSKPRFMDKVKGEMKVLSGKLTRDEKKVEEGKALKNGGVATGGSL